ncbi:MAG TPA: class I SAM-dependent methyltransferase [Marmoricola sp.]|jgi:SAM-dependent methyltransferase|nr:class I SAM-dependent methyltransferase [Marmoricola sp.]
MTSPDYWDAEAATFDDEPDHGLRQPQARAAWRDLLRDVLPQPPARIADLGCGTGTLSLLLAEDGHHVDGVDFAPAMVRQAVAKVGQRAHFVVGDAAAPPLAPGSYDVVLCRHVLWAMPDPSAALRRWRHLLAGGGRLVLVEGFWHTGAGLTAARCTELLEPVGQVEVRPLTDPVLWGGPVEDERYVLVCRT